MRFKDEEYIGDGSTVFDSSWHVRVADVNTDKIIRTDAIARYLQDLAHEFAYGTKAYDDHPYWIVLRTIVEVHEPIEFPDTVSLTRWWSAINSRWANVRANITGAEKGRIETECFWMHVSDKGIPKRVGDKYLAEVSEQVKNTSLSWRPMLDKNGYTEATEEVTVCPRSTDYDFLHHMNNAVQWQLFEEVLQHFPQITSQPYTAIVEHTAPIPLGSQLRVRYKLVDNATVNVWVLLLEENGTMKPAACFRAQPLPRDQVHAFSDPT